MFSRNIAISLYLDEIEIGRAPSSKLHQMHQIKKQIPLYKTNSL